MPPDPVTGRPGRQRSRGAFARRSKRCTIRRRSTACSNRASTLPEAGQSRIHFTVDAAQFPCRRRGAWHALFQDARRCRFLCRQRPGQRPLPADHRLQPALHPADARRTAMIAEGRWISGKRRVFVAEARIVDSTARNAPAAPAPSCARTSPCRAWPGIARLERPAARRRLEATALMRQVAERWRLRDDHASAATPTAAR